MFPFHSLSQRCRSPHLEASSCATFPQRFGPVPPCSVDGCRCRPCLCQHCTTPSTQLRTANLIACFGAANMPFERGDDPPWWARFLKLDPRLRCTFRWCPRTRPLYRKVFAKVSGWTSAPCEWRAFPVSNGVDQPCTHLKDSRFCSSFLSASISVRTRALIAIASRWKASAAHGPCSSGQALLPHARK